MAVKRVEDVEDMYREFFVVISALDQGSSQPSAFLFFLLFSLFFVSLRASHVMNGSS